MSDTPAGPKIPAAFTAAVDSLARAFMRPELVVTEIAAPGTLAPWSFALAADVNAPRHENTSRTAPSHGSDSELGTGRFVLLYDPSSPDAWGGPFRVICFVQAPLETEMGVDPFIADVAWSWLVDALDARGATYRAASGTATRILSTGFGELEAQGIGAQIEVRASWSPADHELSAHAEGWGELLCMLAGLPPAVEGVAVLSARRIGRE